MSKVKAMDFSQSKCLALWIGSLGMVILILPVSVSGEKSSSHSLQCYACGLPKVHPEFDVIGSYGKKIYNHSCDELRNTMKEGVVDDRFVRTCPDGVKSCFGATGFYDHRDTDPTNDITIQFLGCSEAKYKHDYGCDRDLQNVEVKDKSDKKIQVEIDVNLCFCSQHLCNHPDGELMKSDGKSLDAMVNLYSVIFFLTIAMNLN